MGRSTRIPPAPPLCFATTEYPGALRPYVCSETPLAHLYFIIKKQPSAIPQRTTVVIPRTANYSSASRCNARCPVCASATPSQLGAHTNSHIYIHTQTHSAHKRTHLPPDACTTSLMRLSRKGQCTIIARAPTNARCARGIYAGGLSHARPRRPTPETHAGPPL